MVCADNRPDQEIPRVANLKPAVVHECDRCHATVTPAESGQGDEPFPLMVQIAVQ